MVADGAKSSAVVRAAEQAVQQIRKGRYHLHGKSSGAEPAVSLLVGLVFDQKTRTLASHGLRVVDCASGAVLFPEQRAASE